MTFGRCNSCSLCFQAKFQDEWRKGLFKSESKVCHLLNSLFPEKSKRTGLSTCLGAATDHMCRRHFQISLRGEKRRAKIYRGIVLNPGACQIIHLSSVAQLTPLSLSLFPHPNCPHLLTAWGQRSREVFPSVWGLSRACWPPALHYFHRRIPGEISQSQKMRV